MDKIHLGIRWSETEEGACANAPVDRALALNAVGQVLVLYLDCSDPPAGIHRNIQSAIDVQVEPISGRGIELLHVVGGSARDARRDSDEGVVPMGELARVASSGSYRRQLLTEGVAGCIRSTSNDLDRIEPPIGMFDRDPVQHYAFHAAIALKELVILVDVLIADGELRRHHVVLHLLTCLRICYCAAAQESGN